MIDIADTATDDFGNDIVLRQMKSSAAGAKNILLIGRFHGDEPEGEFILEKMTEELQDEKLASPYNIFIITCLNPSGKQKFTRANGHGIDLNRNYPTANFTAASVNPHTGNLSAGTPASEKETQALIRWTETYRPVRILSIHSDLHLVDYDGPAQELAARMAADSGYRLVENVGYPTNGSFGTWAGIERQIPLITLETWKAENTEDFAQIYRELRTAVFNFCRLTPKA